MAQVQDPSDTYKSSRNHVTALDPFDVATGIYYRDYLDLYVKDTIPIEFARTIRNMDPQSRSLGVGGSTSYDMFIVGDVYKFSWVALVLADGAEERYLRISPGTGVSNAVFENRSSLDRFYGSRIAWDPRAGWKVTLREGTEYTVRGCGAKSKPGQCAVTEIKSASGDRLAIDRDAQGNILRITSPHGHTVVVEHDAQGRITKATDDDKHWVAYEYNEAGAMKKATDWQGYTQTFLYDDRFNMTFVREKSPATAGRPACAVTVSNRFDEKNRFAGQRVSNGDFAKVKYTTVESGAIREVDAESREGLMHYVFNEAGYGVREDFTGRNHQVWSLRRIRDADTNAVSDLRLVCGKQEVRLPLRLDGYMEHSDSYIPQLSALCSRIEKLSRDRMRNTSISGHQTGDSTGAGSVAQGMETSKNTKAQSLEQ